MSRVPFAQGDGMTPLKRAALAFVSVAIVAMVQYLLTGPVKDPDLRREQAKRDAWRLYMEASK